MQDEPFSRTIHRVLVLNPVLSISSPGFQKSSPGFVKHESGFFSSPGPGFSRDRIFFESESESGPGFEVCRSTDLMQFFALCGIDAPANHTESYTVLSVAIDSVV